MYLLAPRILQALCCKQQEGLLTCSKKYTALHFHKKLIKQYSSDCITAIILLADMTSKLYRN